MTNATKWRSTDEASVDNFECRSIVLTSLTTLNQASAYQSKRRSTALVVSRESRGDAYQTLNSAERDSSAAALC